MNRQNTTQATEYYCKLCGVKHRSDEDREVFDAHKYWHRDLHVQTVPESYNNLPSFRYLTDWSTR